jgi:hypothetical protein
LRESTGGVVDLLPADLRFVVFCFVKPEDAGAFAERFGVATGKPAVTLKTSGRPERDVQHERKVHNISSCRRTGPIDGQR